MARRDRLGRYRRNRGASKNWAVSSCHGASRSQARSPTPDRRRIPVSRCRPSVRSTKSVEFTTSRSPISSSWSKIGSPKGGAPGHQTSVGRSWMTSGAHDPVQVPGGLPANSRAPAARSRCGSFPFSPSRQWVPIRASSASPVASGSACSTIARDGWRDPRLEQRLEHVVAGRPVGDRHDQVEDRRSRTRGTLLGDDDAIAGRGLARGRRVHSRSSSAARPRGPTSPASPRTRSPPQRGSRSSPLPAVALSSSSAAAGPHPPAV